MLCRWVLRYMAWPVPTFSGKVVSLFHPNPMIPDQAARKRHTELFFAPDTPVGDRTSILKRYRVTHVLVDTTDTAASVLHYLYVIGSVAKSQGTLQIIALPARNG